MRDLGLRGAGMVHLVVLVKSRRDRRNNSTTHAAKKRRLHRRYSGSSPFLTIICRGEDEVIIGGVEGFFL